MDPSPSVRPEASTVHRAASTDEEPQVDPSPSQPMSDLEGAETVIRQGFFDDMMSGGSSRKVNPQDGVSNEQNGPSSSRSKSDETGSRGDQHSMVDARLGASMHTPATLTRELQGQRLNHFELLEQIGGGGMGAVFRARDERLGRIVAVKVVPFAAGDPDLQRRFRNEAQSAAKLDHPLIARVFEVGNDGPWYYIVFEYIDGSNIRDVVSREGTLSLDDAVFYTCQVAEAIGHASRRGIVHRDIKPSNVVVTDDSSIKLVDMGLARSENFDTSEDLTASGVTLGTFDYISPEQAHDPRLADIRSDLYSLGCTFYFMLTGSPPFPGGTMLQKLLNHGNATIPDVRDHRQDASEDLNAILGKMLAKQPDERYQDSAVLIADLRELALREDLPRSRGVNAVAIEDDRELFRSVSKHLPWIVAASILIFSVIALELTSWQKRSDFRSKMTAMVPNSAMESLPVAIPSSESSSTTASSDPSEETTEPTFVLRFPEEDWTYDSSANQGGVNEIALSQTDADSSGANRSRGGGNRIASTTSSSLLSPAASQRVNDFQAGMVTAGDKIGTSPNSPLAGVANVNSSSGQPLIGNPSGDNLSRGQRTVRQSQGSLTSNEPLEAVPLTRQSLATPGDQSGPPQGTAASGIGTDFPTLDRSSIPPGRRPDDPPSLGGFPFPLDFSTLQTNTGPVVPNQADARASITNRATADVSMPVPSRGDVIRQTNVDGLSNPQKTFLEDTNDLSQSTQTQEASTRPVLFLPKDVKSRLVRIVPLESLRVSAILEKAQRDRIALVATLPDAVKLARRTGLERIEIDMPILISRPLKIEQDDLVIASITPGGTTIIFQSNVDFDMQRSDMISIGSNRIELVDLHCYWTVPVTETDGGALIALNANRQVRLTDCSITIDNPSRRDEIYAFNVMTDFSKPVRPFNSFGDPSTVASTTETDPLPLVSLELYNVIVRGQISMVKMDVAAELQLLWENGLLAVSGRMIETGGSRLRTQPKSGSIRLSMERLTSYTPEGLIRMQLSGASAYPVEIERRAEESVFVVAPGVAHVEITGTSPSDRDKDWLRIRGASNAYETDTTLSDPILVVRDEFGQTNTTTMNDLVSDEPVWADDRTPRWVVRWSDPLPDSMPPSRMIPADFRQDGSLIAGFDERNLPKMPVRRTFDSPPTE